ncbi:hypothetical protein OG331_05425 [Streptomyces sp. NBC_01017]|uniref:hypothetical protein n=1 Tax=Streptomyces sp. NBC_01017 TaxID=2903721 RepID=UPI00386D8BBD|nr:hypothetical protein OG331_05425 [Streptomyces sp. NBC_01017]
MPTNCRTREKLSNTALAAARTPVEHGTLQVLGKLTHLVDGRPMIAVDLPLRLSARACR